MENQSEATSTATYKELLNNSEVISKLGTTQPTAVESQIISGTLAGKNVVALCETPYSNAGGLIVAQSEKSGEGDKLVLVVADSKESEALAEQAQTLGLSTYIEAANEDEKPVGRVDKAQVLIGTAEMLLLTVQEKSFEASLCGCLGFEASQGRNLPSAELESLLESMPCKQYAWVSTGVPLAMSPLINKYVKTEDVVEIAAEEESSDVSKELSHEYYEVSRDLLSKPNALCDLIDIAGRPATLIFCNQPSDTDLLEVMLKKRGIAAKKMIGHVPDRAVLGAMDEIRNGTLQALVVTDISARSVNIDDFAMIINHSTPEDPEDYLHRLGIPKADGKLEKMISLVGSTDLGNFHYLRKIVEFDFVQKELPSDEEKAKAVVQNLIDTAKGKDGSYDNGVMELTKALTESGSLDVIVPFLVHNTMRVIPELEANQGKKRGRNDRNRGGDRYDDESENYNRRGSRGDRDRGDRDGRDRKSERVPLEPAKKDIRFYFGAGTDNGLTEEKLVQVAKDLELPEVTEWKRYTLRDVYSFADLPEEFAEAASEKLKGLTLEDGSELYCCKATEISEPRKPMKTEEDSADNDDESQDAESLSAEADQAPA